MLDKAKKVVPVVSFVLYFGTEERWNKNLSIKECLDIPKDPREIKHVDEVLKLLSVMTGDKEYESIEVKNMCEVAQRLIREGREEEILELIMEEYKLERENVLQYL